MRLPATLLALALVAGCAAGPASRVDQGGGLDAARLQRLDAILNADVANGRLPGAVVLVARDGKVVVDRAYGRQDAAKGMPMRADSIFRVYSMTKPIVSVAAMMLVEEGKLQLSDPVSQHIPELKGLRVGVEKGGALEIVAASREATVQDLLRHTSGFTYGVFGKSMVKELYTKNGVDATNHDNAGLVKKLAGVPLMFQPGSTWEYSRSTDVLGHVIERVSRQPLDRFLEERIFRPLGMKDTAFFVPEEKQGRLAEAFATDPDSKRPVSLLEVRRKPTYLAGGQGLVSTAPDYLRFAQMLLNGGELDGVRIVSKKTVAYMTTDHLGAVRGPTYLPGPGYGFGLGVAVRTADGEASYPGSAGDYFWGGLGGTYFWVDPKERLVAIWMMQAPGQRTYYRGLFRNLVYGAMMQ
jgi:CubicO group peptidase (beta-lactamase class C family)